MKIKRFGFGFIEIGGATYPHDVVIERGRVSKRREKPSKPLRDRLRAHAADARGGDPQGLPPPRHRHRSLAARRALRRGRRDIEATIRRLEW